MIKLFHSYVTQFILGLLLIFLYSCDTYNIIDKPIIFNKLRDSLTLEYLSSHYDLVQESPTISPKMIVLHWTAIPTFEKTFETFDQALLPESRSGIKSAGALNVSSHFLIDRDGSIYRLMPETKMARHVIGLNHCAIGVENVGGPNQPLTEAQVNANILLINDLVSRYEIEYLIGHHEYTLFDGHELWLEKDRSYRTEKSDPGVEFMRKVRKKVIDLNLKGAP